MVKKIYLPHNFNPYPHQKKVIDAFRSEKYKKFINVWHRRAGKDTTWFNIMTESALERVGYYLYLLETIGQAREVIWDGIGREGKKFIDFIPKDAIRSVNNSDMKIKLQNGAILKFGGTDNYNAHMGTNPVGIILSEYSLQNPIAWELLSPILAENDGWVSFVYTFRGNNHGYELYEKNKDNPDFFTSFNTVNDTVKHDGTPIVSKDKIESLINSGVPETKIKQEFFNIPVSMEGAYFGHEIMLAERQNRVIDFPIDRKLPVNTYWDLGWSDSTAIWLVQRHRNEYRCVGYHENNFKDLTYYKNWLDEFRTENNITYSEHFAPWDAGIIDLSTGKSLQQSAAKLGLKFRLIPKCNNKMNVIKETRMIFNKIYIHKTNCKQGIKCIKEYHSMYNEKLNAYGKPCHNWASHGADAFMGIAQMDDKLNNQNKSDVMHDRVNNKSLF